MAGPTVREWRRHDGLQRLWTLPRPSTSVCGDSQPNREDQIRAEDENTLCKARDALAKRQHVSREKQSQL